MSAVARRVWGDVNNALHAARLRHFRELRIGEVLESDGAFAIVTGPTSNIENGVVCDDGELPAAEAEQLVSWVRAYGVPASWIQAETDTSERLDAELKALGCREETTGIDMGARIADLDLARGGAAMEITEVRDSATLKAWADIADACGWFDEPAIRAGQERLYSSIGLGRPGPFRHWLVRRDGVPVAMASAFFGGGAVLLEYLAIVPDERGRGVGTALVSFRLREAARRGCDTAVLSPTPDSQGFYERLGFTVTRVRPRRWYYL